MPDIALKVDNVSKKFKRGELHDSLRDLIPAVLRSITGKDKASEPLKQREFWALQDVSFELQRGEAFGVVGSNGAGKSTILKLLSGIIKPTHGQIIVNGKLSALIEVGAGFHPDLTGRENVYLNGTILGMSKSEIARKFDEIVEFSGLADFIDTPVKRYSSGMFARLGFSVAAHVDPDILIVDEVLSVGDYVFQKKCIDRMNAIIHGGASVIFVSHNLRAVTDLCTRSLLLERGRVVQIGPTHDIIQNYIERNTRRDAGSDDKDVYISNVTLRDTTGARVEVVAGTKVWVDVEVRARRAADKVAVVLELKDDSFYGIFNTSSERLGVAPARLSAGQSLRCTFELDAHLTAGTFYLNVALYRYDIQKVYDEIFPAWTLFIRSNTDVRGAANLYPRVAVYESVPANTNQS